VKKFLSLAVLLSLVGCSRHASEQSANARPTVDVHVGKVTLDAQARTQEVAGTVRPFARAVVSARIMGVVAKSRLALGEHFQAGAVLVTLQADETQARVDQTRAALRQAERDYTRESALAAKGASTDETVRTAADQRDQARAALVQAGTMLSYTKITAPFSGVITGEFVKPGDLASPGTPLFEIQGMDHMRVEAGVPENLPALPVGRPVAVTWLGQKVEGTLVETSPASDPLTRTRLVKVELPAGAAVGPGQFVRLLWPDGHADSLSIPDDAVVTFGQMEQVFVVSDGRAHLRLVKTGARAAGRVEIFSGLNAGETVVVEPPAGLRDGDSVKILP
jgi:RND family efflux transporter MFP subunit